MFYNINIICIRVHIFARVWYIWLVQVLPKYSIYEYNKNLDNFRYGSKERKFIKTKYTNKARLKTIILYQSNVKYIH